MNLRALPAQADHLTTYLEGLEEFLFDPVERRDVASVSSLLAEDFREIGLTGRIYSKVDILEEISSEQSVYVTLSDFTCDLVAPGVALVTYKSLSTHDGRPPSQSIRSSVWVQRPVPSFGSTGPGREMRWQMLFHQGTRL
jgi:glyoxylase I family protein